MLKLLISVFLLVALQVGATPSGWWKDSLGKQVKTYQELLDYANGEGKYKHLIVDFYMENCKYCYEFQSSWNQIVGDLTSLYGEDVIEFIKVDGEKVRDISSLYNVHSYPTFAYSAPQMKGAPTKTFTASRTFNNFKNWILDLLQNETPLDATYINPFSKVKEMTALKEDLKDVGDKTQQYKGVALKGDQFGEANEALVDMMAVVTEQTLQQSKKIDTLYSYIALALEEIEMVPEDDEKVKQAVKPESTQQPPLAYFLGGIIVGCVGGIILVGYLGKQNQSMKSKKNSYKKNDLKQFNNSDDQETLASLNDSEKMA